MPEYNFMIAKIELQLNYQRNVWWFCILTYLHIVMQCDVWERFDNRVITLIDYN